MGAIVSSWGQLFLNSLGWRLAAGIALGIAFVVIGLSKPITKTTLDPTLKEIADLRPDAFSEGVHQRHSDANGQLETTLVATFLILVIAQMRNLSNLSLARASTCNLVY